MPKMKTKRSATKRFKLTASGKVKHRRAFRSHILTKKGSKPKRQKRFLGQLKKCDMKAVKACLCAS